MDSLLRVHKNYIRYFRCKSWKKWLHQIVLDCLGSTGYRENKACELARRSARPTVMAWTTGSSLMPQECTTMTPTSSCGPKFLWMISKNALALSTDGEIVTLEAKIVPEIDG